MTSHAPRAAVFFDRFGRWIHAKSVEHHVQENPGENRKAEPFRTFPPFLTKTSSGLREGLRVVATARVNSLGSIDDLVVAGVRDDHIRAEVEACVREWLFLPRLSNGAAVESTVRIPIDLRSD